jgi:predicted hydrocarbon binding protein
VKEVFEAALGKPVEVDLTQAIGRGDKVCKFVVLQEDN